MNHDLAFALRTLQTKYNEAEFCLNKIRTLSSEYSHLHPPREQDYFSEELPNKEDYLWSHAKRKACFKPSFEPKRPIWLFVSGFVCIICFIIALRGDYPLPVVLLTIPSMIVAFCLSVWNISLFFLYGIRYISYVRTKLYNEKARSICLKEYKKLQQEYEQKKRKCLDSFDRDYSALMDEYEKKCEKLGSACKQANQRFEEAKNAFNSQASSIGWPHNFSQTNIHELNEVTESVVGGRADSIKEALQQCYNEQNRREEEKRRRETEQCLNEKYERQEKLFEGLATYLIASERQKQEEADRQAEFFAELQSRIENSRQDKDPEVRTAGEKQCSDCEKSYCCAHKGQNNGYCSAFSPYLRRYV